MIKEVMEQSNNERKAHDCRIIYMKPANSQSKSSQSSFGLYPSSSYLRHNRHKNKRKDTEKYNQPKTQIIKRRKRRRSSKENNISNNTNIRNQDVSKKRDETAMLPKKSSVEMDKQMITSISLNREDGEMAQKSLNNFGVKL